MDRLDPACRLAASQFEVVSEKRIYQQLASLPCYVGLPLPTQPVDATPSSALIQQRFCGRTTCLASLGQNLARGSVPAGLSLASDFAFCFQCQPGSSLVLPRPIEITALIRHLKSRDVPVINLRAALISMPLNRSVVFVVSTSVAINCDGLPVSFGSLAIIAGQTSDVDNEPIRIFPRSLKVTISPSTSGS